MYECTVCGKVKETCVRSFDVMYYRFTDRICRECFETETGEWTEDRPWEVSAEPG